MEVKEDCIGEDGGVPDFSQKTLEPPDPLTFWKGSSWAKFRLLPDDEHRPFVPTYLNDLIERAGGRIVTGEGDSGKGRVMLILDELYLVKKLDDPACVGKKVPKNTYSTSYIYHAISNKKRGRNPPDKKAYLLDSSQTIREVLMAAMEPDPDEDGDEGGSSEEEYEEMEDSVPDEEGDEGGGGGSEDEDTEVIEHSDSEEYEDMDRKPSSSKKIQRSTSSTSKKSKTMTGPENSPSTTASAQKARAPTIPNGDASSTSVPTVAGSLIKSRSATSVVPTNATSSSSKEVGKASTSAMPSGDPKPARNSGETMPPRSRLVPVAVAGPSTSGAKESKTRTEKRTKGGVIPRATGGSGWIDVRDQESDDNVELSDLNASEGETSGSESVAGDPGPPPPRNGSQVSSVPRAYTPGEDKKIVKMIFEQDGAYKWTRGRKIWEKMESSAEFSGNRTWQSLSNRWRKTIVPRLMKKNIKYTSDYYRISERRVRKFQKFHNKTPTHSGGCPDDVRF